jgi:peptide/nickel transport system permease protein
MNVDIVTPHDHEPEDLELGNLNEPDAEETTERAWKRVFRKGHRAASIAIISLLALGIVGPLLAPHDPNQQSLRDRLRPPVGFGGTWSHPMGTDGLGRDVFSGVLTGARPTLFIGVFATAIALVVGVALGLLAGYRGGFWDRTVGAVIDVQLAFPGLLLVIVITSYLDGGYLLVIFTLALVSWMVFARLARSLALTLREQSFVEAARLSGSSHRTIMFRHLLANMTGPLATLALLEVARLMLAEAGLSYLGFGVQPPDTSWGLMIAEGQEYLRQAWWIVTFPGLMILLSVFSFNVAARATGARGVSLTRLS